MGVPCFFLHLNVERDRVPYLPVVYCTGMAVLSVMLRSLLAIYEVSFGTGCPTFPLFTAHM